MAVCMRQEKVFIEVKYGAFLKLYLNDGLGTSDKEMADKSENSGATSSEHVERAQGQGASAGAFGNWRFHEKGPRP